MSEPTPSSSSPILALSVRPRLRLLTLCILYLAQGIPYGFVSVTLAALLAERGLSTAEVGQVLALATLPWALKWAWGPVIDRLGVSKMGRRRPWILGAQFMMAMTILGMALVEDLVASTALLGGLVFLHNVFNSLQDVAVDALAVDLLDDKERGRANGLMWGSKYLGIAIGGAGLATLIASMGLRGTLVVQAAILAGIMLFPLLLRERPGDALFPWRKVSRRVPAIGLSPERVESMRGLFRALFRAFTLRSTLLGALLALLSQVVEGVLHAVASVFFTQELGWAAEDYAQVVGGPVVIAGLVGAIVGGWLADRYGPRRMIAFAFVGIGLVMGALSLGEVVWSDRFTLTGLLMLNAGLASLSTVCFFALFMGISWPKVAATQFTAYMALLNLSTTMGQKVAGTLDELFSYPALFVALGVFQASLIVILPLIDPTETRRIFGVASGGEEASAPNEGTPPTAVNEP